MRLGIESGHRSPDENGFEILSNMPPIASPHRHETRL